MIFLLDAYHLGDPLFLAGFTRDVGARDQSAPLLFVHGGGEAAERALEAAGRAVRRAHGVLAVSSVEEAETVERATRELGREITHGLNEAGVPAVRFTGADRGVLRYGSGESGPGESSPGGSGPGGLAVSADWLLALARQGAVPVVAALASGEAGAPLREVAAGLAAAGLAHALGLPLGLVGTRSGGAESEAASQEADRMKTIVVENARSGWNRRAVLGG